MKPETELRFEALERALRAQAKELAALRAALPNAIEGMNQRALLAATNARLIGENARLRDNELALKRRLVQYQNNYGALLERLAQYERKTA